MGRKKHSIEDTKQALISRYGDSFICDLERLKKSEYGTLSSIGIKYNVSREYIRQMFERLFCDSVRNLHSNVKIRIKNSSGCLYDPRRKCADYSKNYGPVYKGAKSELVVFKKLKELGFNDISFGRSVDFKINGKLVEIKSSFKIHKTSKYAVYGYFRFALSKIQREKADFLICYDAVYSRFFIIPNSYFKNKPCVYIPPPINNCVKLQKEISVFENNFDALKRMVDTA